jgi:hypothetical protein
MNEKKISISKNAIMLLLALSLRLTLTAVTPSILTENSNEWQRYTNEEHQFSIDYPSTWKAIDFNETLVGFQPPWMKDNKIQWGIMLIEKETNATFQNLIKNIQTVYPNSSAETTEKIALNKRTGQHTVVTTTENPSWRYEQIILRNFEKMYVLNNGAIEDKNFELFWRSIKFIQKIEQKVKDDA